MLPGTILYVVGADAVTKGLTRGEVPWVLVGALIGIIVVLFVIVRFARKKLQDKEGASGAGTQTDRGKQS
jgi:membrane protein implicated in regulation of membrane protease activity